MAPTISVLITNFNYARFLPQAIDSVLAQTVPPHQVVVVDDGSTDDSLAVLRKRYSSTVEVLAKPNGGQGSAFNAGFTRCDGNVICLLDADDYWRPGKLAAVAAAFRRTPYAAMVRHDLVFEELGGPQDGRRVLGLRPSTHRAVHRSRALTDRHHAPTSALAFKRELLEKILPMPELDFRISADAYLYTLACTVGEVVDLEEALAVYRLHGNNGFANDGERSQRRALRTELALLHVLQARGADPVVPHHLYRSARRLGDQDAAHTLLQGRSRLRRVRDCASVGPGTSRRLAHALGEALARTPSF